MFSVPIKHETDVGIGNMQTTSMEDQYESVNLADFDVVRSTQFVDDMSRGVFISYILGFDLNNNEAWPSRHMNCSS